MRHSKAAIFWSRLKAWILRRSWIKQMPKITQTPKSLVLTLLMMSACSQLPVQQRDQGGFYQDGPGKFAVFTNDGSAVAIRLGDEQIPDMVAHGARAIERATGCQIVNGSLRNDEKTVEADIACAAPAAPAPIDTQTAQY
jgi:hypothetical protein